MYMRGSNLYNNHMLWFKRLAPVLLLAAILGLVIYFVEPPKSLTNQPTKIISFLILLGLFLTSLFNLIFRFILRSLVLSLGVISFLILKLTGNFNLLSGLVLIVATFILAKLLKKPKPTYQTKIPKLSKLQKQW